MPPNTAVPSDCRLAAPAPVREHQRQHAEDEGERGHQDRPQPQPSRLHRRVDDRQAFLAPPLGEFDDQNGVLRREPDQHDEADLRIDVDLHLPRSQIAPSEPISASGADDSTMNGIDQLSYCAARITNTKKIASASTTEAIEPALSS